MDWTNKVQNFVMHGNFGGCTCTLSNERNKLKERNIGVNWTVGAQEPDLLRNFMHSIGETTRILRLFPDFLFSIQLRSGTKSENVQRSFSCSLAQADWFTDGGEVSRKLKWMLGWFSSFPCSSLPLFCARNPGALPFRWLFQSLSRGPTTDKKA